MPAHDTPDTAPSPLLSTFLTLGGAYRLVVRQERVFVRLVMLSVGSLLTLGRQTLSQVLVALGVADRDWTAWYRVFNWRRLDVAALQQILVAQVRAELPTDGPIVVGVDATQLPRPSRRMPGCGYTVQARTPKWRRGIHLAQRFAGISGLLPRSEGGESRAVPLRWLPLRTAQTTPLDAEPERTESHGALERTTWLRGELDARDRAAQPLVVLGDGVYSNAGVGQGLPERPLLFARCAKNRALFAVPSDRPGPGRQRRYGERGPSPTQTRHQPDGWHTYRFPVRGRDVTVTAKVTGPWVIRNAPFDPVLLVVVKGVDRGTGTTRRQRDPQFFLTSVVMTSEDEWHLPVPVPELLAWAWQRWEVEVMHRELKSSFGVGEPQAWSAAGAGGALVGLGLCAAGAGRLPDVGIGPAAGTGSGGVVATAPVECGPPPAGSPCRAVGPRRVSAGLAANPGRVGRNHRLARHAAAVPARLSSALTPAPPPGPGATPDTRRKPRPHSLRGRAPLLKRAKLKDTAYGGVDRFADTARDIVEPAALNHPMRLEPDSELVIADCPLQIKHIGMRKIASEGRSQGANGCRRGSRLHQSRLHAETAATGMRS